MTTTLPPHNIDAEVAVIGSLLIDGDCIQQVYASLKPTDFYHEPLKVCYQACLALYERKTTINQITLAQELNHQQQLEPIGGVAYLSHVMSLVPTSLDIDEYAEIVRRLSMCRRMILAGQQIQTIGYAAHPDTVEALAKCETILDGVRKGEATTRLMEPKARADSLMARFAELYEANENAARSTGLSHLDELLGGGFFPGEFIIIGGRPSMGKTSLGRFFAHRLSIWGTVLFYTREMTYEGLAYRDIAQRVGVSINEIRRGRYSQDLYDKIILAIAEGAEDDIIDIDDAPMTTAKILTSASHYAASHRVSAIVIDYIGLLDDEYGSSANERISYISRNIKGLARRMNVPVLALAQLNRAVTGMADRRPQLHHLRDTGSLEQDADVVLFLHREKYYDPNVLDDITEIIVAKQRQGEAGVGVRTRFQNQEYVQV